MDLAEYLKKEESGGSPTLNEGSMKNRSVSREVIDDHTGYFYGYF